MAMGAAAVALVAAATAAACIARVLRLYLPRIVRGGVLCVYRCVSVCISVLPSP